MPHCKRCKTDKEDEDFTKGTKIMKQCNACRNRDTATKQRKLAADPDKNKEKRKAYAKKYRQENKAKIKAYRDENSATNNSRSKAWREANPDRVKANNRRLYDQNRGKYLQQKKEYYVANRAKIQAYNKKRRKENPEHVSALAKIRYKKRMLDPQFRASAYGRNITRKMVLEGFESEKAIALVGCNAFEFWCHIHEQLTDGMTWDNYGEWELDHIHPCSKFDLTDEDECKACFCYTNVQPLWKADNKAKGSRTDWERAE